MFNLHSGSAIMQDGSTIRNGYRLDLDTLSVGSRIGMMRCSDGTLHYYLDGMDQGVACTDISPGERLLKDYLSAMLAASPKPVSSRNHVELVKALH